MNRPCVLPILCLLLATDPVPADDVFAHPGDVATITHLLRRSIPGAGQVEVLRGQFSQRKMLREIPTPLNSVGEFVFARNSGIWWHTQTPFDSEFILSRGGMAQRDSGIETMNVNGDQQQEFQTTSMLFFALFTLDVDTLSQTFDLYGIADHQHWQLGLRPKSAAVAALFKDALISGGENVKQVVLHEANGDSTEINLHAVRSEQTALTVAERKRFGFPE